MTRALPYDLLPIIDSRGPSVANPGLRVLRWLDWGDQFRFQDTDEISYLKMAVNLFKKQAKADSALSWLLAIQHARIAERMEGIRQQGHVVRNLRAACAGRLRIGLAEPGPSDPGILIDRNMGTPFVPAPNVWKLIDAGMRMQGGSQSDIRRESITAFDAFPLTVPRLESEQLPSGNNVPVRTSTGSTREMKPPVELLSVVPGSEFEFWITAQDEGLLATAIQGLQTALAAFSAVPKGLQDDDASEVEIAPGPVVIASEDGSTTGMLARASTVHYQVNNGRIVAMFRHSAGKDVKAEEHASNVAMPEEVRKRLAKKRLLQDVEIEVEAVGNGWRIRGIRG